jgi:hypothetical protein
MSYIVDRTIVDLPYPSYTNKDKSAKTINVD